MVVEFDMLGPQTGTIKEIMLQECRRGYFRVMLIVHDQVNNMDCAVEVFRITKVLEGEECK